MVCSSEKLTVCVFFYCCTFFLQMSSYRLSFFLNAFFFSRESIWTDVTYSCCNRCELPGCGHLCWCCRCAVCTLCRVSSPHTHTLWQARCMQCPTDWLPNTRLKKVKHSQGNHFQKVIQSVSYPCKPSTVPKV